MPAKLIKEFCEWRESDLHKKQIWWSNDKTIIEIR